MHGDAKVSAGAFAAQLAGSGISRHLSLGHLLQGSDAVFVLVLLGATDGLLAQLQRAAGPPVSDGLKVLLETTTYGEGVCLELLQPEVATFVQEGSRIGLFKYLYKVDRVTVLIVN